MQSVSARIQAQLQNDGKSKGNSGACAACAYCRQASGGRNARIRRMFYRREPAPAPVFDGARRLEQVSQNPLAEAAVQTNSLDN